MMSQENTLPPYHDWEALTLDQRKKDFIACWEGGGDEDVIAWFENLSDGEQHPYFLQTQVWMRDILPALHDLLCPTIEDTKKKMESFTEDLAYIKRSRWKLLVENQRKLTKKVLAGVVSRIEKRVQSNPSVFSDVVNSAHVLSEKKQQLLRIDGKLCASIENAMHDLEQEIDSERDGKSELSKKYELRLREVRKHTKELREKTELNKLSKMFDDILRLESVVRKATVDWNGSENDRLRRFLESDEKIKARLSSISVCEFVDHIHGEKEVYFKDASGDYLSTIEEGEKTFLRVIVFRGKSPKVAQSISERVEQAYRKRFSPESLVSPSLMEQEGDGEKSMEKKKNDLPGSYVEQSSGEGMLIVAQSEAPSLQQEEKGIPEPESSGKKKRKKKKKKKDAAGNQGASDNQAEQSLSEAAPTVAPPETQMPDEVSLAVRSATPAPSWSARWSSGTSDREGDKIAARFLTNLCSRKNYETLPKMLQAFQNAERSLIKSKEIYFALSTIDILRYFELSQKNDKCRSQLSIEEQEPLEKKSVWELSLAVGRHLLKLGTTAGPLHDNLRESVAFKNVKTLKRMNEEFGVDTHEEIEESKAELLRKRPHSPCYILFFSRDQECRAKNPKGALDIAIQGIENMGRKCLENQVNHVDGIYSGISRNFAAIGENEKETYRRKYSGILKTAEILDFDSRISEHNRFIQDRLMRRSRQSSPARNL